MAGTVVSVRPKEIKATTRPWLALMGSAEFKTFPGQAALVKPIQQTYAVTAPKLTEVSMKRSL